MSGYQSLHDLIIEHVGDDIFPHQSEALANAIITEWMPTEAEAVIQAKREAEKQKKQLEKVRNDNQQTMMTANMPNVGGAM
ncbi:hypothetical protein [Rhodococcus sp. 008]|uniref:hypothetical protein n=1 Tax=Rhodococcus sp. 008 TaxID=1723645 RepID=UPI0008062F31|nr:hypothetical protein [Rhodococcus sp. 008]ANQ73191.1 hypothetical protein AOT96_21835 [Rhodococcus sp. 008]